MTECVHIGSFDEPIMVFGGPYGNLEATAALLAAAQRARIAPARMLCTGDLVAYCADPQATVDMIRGAGITVIMGNCDESLGQGAADCDCGFAKGSTCDILAVQWFAYASRVLDADAKAWMRTLPRQVALTLAGRRLVAVHGNANQINRFVFASTASAETLEACAHLDADGILGGHAGLPFTEITQDCLWHNAGVIGVPANDATPRVWYSILRPVDDGIAIEHCALEYDHRAAAAKLVARGLPRPYAEALVSGMWPADDILPDTERHRGGQPLATHCVFWPHPERVRASA
ncbi:MAG: metallophosphoesterase family protein [Acidiferrobacterales bacterium]